MTLPSSAANLLAFFSSQGYGSHHQQDPNFPSTQQHQQYGAGSPWQQQQQQHYTQQVSSNVPYMAPVPPVSGGLADQLNTLYLLVSQFSV
jgi:hypothetical protein